MLSQQIKDPWIKALRSKKYRQGFGKYYNKEDDTYCVYGVLKAILGEEAFNVASTCVSYMHMSFFILNDMQKLTFNELADIIEEKL